LAKLFCKICNNSENNEAYQIKEMMFGFRDEFTYFECSKCGCLQIDEYPRNIGKYYPPYYCSFRKGIFQNSLKQNLIRKRDAYALFKKGFFRKLLSKKYPYPLFDQLSMTKINFNSKILDVGCGAGNLLYSLKDLGFKDLVGVDPFIDEKNFEMGIRILKKVIYDLPDDQKFDLIILNHSFEHILDQLETLVKVSAILSEQGICFMRMPVKTEYIWNRYGTNWVQIDAPRHFFLHTLKSFELLVKKSDLVIEDVIFDSTEFQFWGSEQYKMDISLEADNSYSVTPKKSMFTTKQIREFKRMAKELNKIKQGDQAAFYLKKNKK